MQQTEAGQVNVQILNSLLYLYAEALKPHEIEAKVLAEFEKHQIKYDQNTYAHLAKLYLNTRDLDQVIKLFQKSQEVGLKPVAKLAHCYLEAGIRKEDTELIMHGLHQFLKIGLEPHHRVLKLLSNLHRLPDELYVMLRKNFPNYGKLVENVRSFEQASFRPDAVGKDKGLDLYTRHKSNKRFNPKKNPGKTLPYKTRKNLIL